jgi:hypothetical protein
VQVRIMLVMCTTIRRAAVRNAAGYGLPDGSAIRRPQSAHAAGMPMVFNPLNKKGDTL